MTEKRRRGTRIEKKREGKGLDKVKCLTDNREIRWNRKEVSMNH